MARVRDRLRLTWPLALAVVCAALASAAAPAHSTLSAERFMQHVSFLASESLGGRGNGSPELEHAAAYIGTEFQSYGLDPAGDDGSFLQRFPLTIEHAVGPSSALRIDGASQRPGVDFLVLPLSNAGSFDGRAVFVGYGITAPQFGWDDYAGVDVAGKAVIVLDHVPGSMLLSSRALGYMAPFEMKIRNARRHGAGAVLVVRDPAVEYATMEGAETDHVSAHDLGLPAVRVTARSIDRLFARAGTTVRELKRRIDTSLRSASMEVPLSSVAVATDVRRTSRTIANVLAMIPGSDPVLNREWLVIGAHYDHLGRRRQRGTDAKSDKTYYGADDNASGTAGVLEIARTLAHSRPKRSILFAAFAGEEIGLLGSGHLVDHFPVPLASVRAMLNLDMIGRLSDGPVSIMGSRVPTQLAEWIRRENVQAGLSLVFATSNTASSDWAMFQASGVPALTFFTGMHDDYHRPLDTADKINAAAAIKVVSLAAGTARRVADADSDSTIEWLPLQDAPGQVHVPRFGSEPVYHAGLGGLRFDSVTSGSPAAKAGLEAGDVVVQFGELPVRTLADFRWTLETYKPGDMPALDVRRRGKPLRLVVTLESERN